MISIDGDDYGTAAQIAAALTSPTRPITPDRIRDWARRSATPGDPLHGLLPRHQGRETWYRLADAAHVERATRTRTTVRTDA